MKRILTCLLVFALLAVCWGCTSEPELPLDADHLPGEPAQYACAVLVSINPSFLLYLNERGDVIAYEAMNADAKKMQAHTMLLERHVRDAIMDIVAVALDDGYLESGGDVRIELVRTELDLRESNLLLDEAQEGARRAADDRSVTVNPVKVVSVTFPSEPEETAFETPEDNHTPEPVDEPEETPNEPEETPRESETPVPEPTQHEEGCSVCFGSGICVRCHNARQITCEVCHGAGKLTCGQCDGTGKMRCSCGDGKCWHCHGAATLPCECGGNDPDCMACHGTGRTDCNSCEHGECSQCGGTLFTGPCNRCGGKTYEECYPCRGTGKTDCQGCKGTGRCEACDGTGKNLHKNQP